MSIQIPSLKVSGSEGSSGAKNRRTIVGVVQGFLQSEGSNVIDTVAIKVISPGGKMDGKLAHVKLEDIGDDGAKRTSIATRVPGKTEKVPDPMNKGKYLDAPLKTDWIPDMTVVRMEQAFFSGKGDGSPDAPYQMESRWSSTFSPEESRSMPVESAYVTRYEKDGVPSYRVFAPMPSQSILIPANQAGAAADEIANATRQEGGHNMGLTALVVNKDKEVTQVFQIRSFAKYDEKAENKSDRVTVPEGSKTFNDAAKKSGVTLADDDSVLIIPHNNLSVTGVDYMEPKHIKSWDALNKLTVKDGEANPRASVLALSPNGIVTNVAPVGYAHNFMEKAMEHVGLIEPKQYEEKSATMEDKAEKVTTETADEGMSPDNY